MIFKCKMCGGDIEQIENTNTGKCIYCKSVMTLPNLDNERIVNLYNRANALRLANDFDKAREVYESILEIDNNQIEAHWGILLCKYGIEYIDDPNTKEKIPTCHRTNDYSILLDQDFKIIKKESFGEALKLYEKEAKQIDEIQKNILAISKKEKPYDVFICYKESDEKGERTHDSVIAQDIYDKLVEQGYKVFFARITLEDKLGQEFEPYIYSALKSAKVMLVVGTKEEHFNAVWVKNEWSRYLEIMKSDKGKALIPVYSKIDAYKLPEEFAMLQAQSMDKVGAIQDLVRGVGKIVKEYKTEEVEGIDKETVAKVKAALDEARNLGNGQYEVTILKENLPVWYYGIIIIALVILTFIYLVGIALYFTYYNIKSVPLYRIHPRIPLLFYGISFITCILSILFAIKRKTYKYKKILNITSLLSLSLVVLTAAKYLLIPEKQTIIILFIIFVAQIIIYFINPSWTLNSSSKSIMTAEEKDKQLAKNKYIKDNFKVKEHLRIKFPIYIIIFLIIIVFGCYDYYMLTPKYQSNKKNTSVSQIEILNRKYMFSKPVTIGYDNTNGYTYYIKDYVKNIVRKNDIYDILDYKLENYNLFLKVKTNKNITGWILKDENVQINCNKNDDKCSNYTIATNERNTKVKQLMVQEDYINIRKEATTSSEIIGRVNKNDIYTIYGEEVFSQGSKWETHWYKIKTNIGIEGWISGMYNGSSMVTIYEPE